jgi:hypothetical protein
VNSHKRRGSLFRYSQGKSKSKVLGFIKDMTKGQAREAAARIVAEERTKREAGRVWTFGEFVDEAYFPYYSRKWKRSTRDTNVSRIRFHLREFNERELTSFHREELQALLNSRTIPAFPIRSSIICAGI